MMALRRPFFASGEVYARILYDDYIGDRSHRPVV